MELRECPLCGQKDMLVGPEHGDDDWWIECRRCEFVLDEPSKSVLLHLWNHRPAEDCLRAENKRLQERERRCPTMLESEARALVRALQEIMDVLGLDSNGASPGQTVKACRSLRARVERLEKALALLLSFHEQVGSPSPAGPCEKARAALEGESHG